MFKILDFRKFLKILFLIYVVFLIYVLFFKSEYSIKTSFTFLSEEHIKYCLNLKPLNTIKRYLKAYLKNNVSFLVMLGNLFGNFILFMPMSFFIVYKLKNISLLKYSFSLIIFIICVEILQFLCMVGIADIDDIILNFSGGILSFIFLKMIKFRKIA